MDASKIYESAILKKGEEVIEQVECKYRSKEASQSFPLNGTMIITNKRLLFVKKPGWFSKGLDVAFQCSLREILGVSTKGFITKQLNVSVEKPDGSKTIEFPCNKAELLSKKIIENKERFIEEKVIEAQRVIIEEGKKDNAEEILKKKLSKGEITLEEFHQKIQRL